jgi:hypothetical protein
VTDFVTHIKNFVIIQNPDGLLRGGLEFYIPNEHALSTRRNAKIRSQTKDGFLSFCTCKSEIDWRKVLLLSSRFVSN